MGEKKTKSMLYSTPVEIEVEVGNKIGLVSVCVKLQLSSSSRSCLKVCGSGVGGLAVATLSNLNLVCSELLQVELSWVFKINSKFNPTLKLKPS